MVHRLVNAYFDPPLLIVISGVPAWILVSPGHWFWYPPPDRGRNYTYLSSAYVLFLKFCLSSSSTYSQGEDKCNRSCVLGRAGLGEQTVNAHHHPARPGRVALLFLMLCQAIGGLRLLSLHWPGHVPPGCFLGYLCFRLISPPTGAESIKSYWLRLLSLHWPGRVPPGCVACL